MQTAKNGVQQEKAVIKTLLSRKRLGTMRLINKFFSQKNWKKRGLDKLPKKLSLQQGTFQLVLNLNVSGFYQNFYVYK